MELLYFKVKFDWGTLIGSDDKAFPGLMTGEINKEVKKRGVEKQFDSASVGQLVEKYVEAEDKEWEVWSHGFTCAGTKIGEFYEKGGLGDLMASLDAAFAGKTAEDPDIYRRSRLQDFCVDWAKKGRAYAEAEFAKDEKNQKDKSMTASLE